MNINQKHLSQAIKDILIAKLVPFISGSPGIGKSEIIKQVAEDFDLELIDFRLAQCDPTDLVGIPINDKGRLDFAPPKTIPLEGDPIPKGKSGWLLFLDEMNAAPLSVQSSSYKLVLDRMVGQHKLHPNVAIVCAGNKSSDRAITNRLSTAMQSRLIHLNLEVDTDSWIDWAENKGIDHRIISFIRFRPELLHKFDPSHSDNTFSTPRTWHFAHKLIKDKEVTSSMLPILAGTIGEGPAFEFKGFLDIYHNLPSFKDIEVNPMLKTNLEEPSHLYALSGLVSSNLTESNIPKVMKFIERMPKEFQVITLQSSISRNKSWIKIKEVQQWIKQNASELL